MKKSPTIQPSVANGGALAALCDGLAARSPLPDANRTTEPTQPEAGATWARTDEFSFILRCSRISGVGVFALHGIAKSTWLEVFPRSYRSRRFKAAELPSALRQYCTAKENGVYAGPQQFNRMYIGWYLNHSSTPNAGWDDDLDGYVALRDISHGEEILIDYNLFEEPEHAKAAFYGASADEA